MLQMEFYENRTQLLNEEEECMSSIKAEFVSN